MTPVLAAPDMTAVHETCRARSGTGGHSAPWEWARVCDGGLLQSFHSPFRCSAQQRLVHEDLSQSMLSACQTAGQYAVVTSVRAACRCLDQPLLDDAACIHPGNEK